MPGLPEVGGGSVRLFRTTFGSKAGTATQSDSFRVLSGSLNELVASGLCPRAPRRGAEITVWASVHERAELIVNGPMNSLDATRRGDAVSRMLELNTRAVTG
jgi:hypothetical protein